ncbi:PREDICTED: ATP-dependent RNA helicase SUPV3L1, mitochondrial-like [Acropora digitifera]|uniref:ATP-dependent RNA helicase SUPV3L1, mitochondrial-like n=1 Tax=Acropora digitifera TaxID=70779 RepID=UPI00077AA217|nr:PREDICTED: ATP-dependent RNA helicase SUPV3L1, mitochondrial-like [Acropora digitifera]
MLRVLSKTYCNSVSTDGPSKLYPLFFAFARKVHPMLNCIDEVKKISDLRGPADLFLEARAVKRKIIYHAGPTNSGKTHSALARFRAANTGVYCGPLRLLATEVAKRTNEAGVLCDLLTGEDRQWAISPEEPANHIAATVEMCSTETFYDCAVIDEIQMMKDKGRGWAWTRTLLGLPCPEIHVCGEHSAVDIVQRLVASCNDEMEVYHYKRLSPLLVTSHHSLDGKLERVKPGDCVVAFSQQELYRLRREIEEKTSRKCAIIYGGLPPATKIEQESKFNDPEDECSVLVASDAIGMGLNLWLKREDSKLLHSLITTPTEDVKAAGLAPTLEQIEMLSQQLSDASLVKLYDVFESVVQLDGANYFMCDLEFKKKIAHKIRGLPLSITDQYVFSTAPLNAKTIDFAPKFAFNVCHEIELTASRLKKLIDWPPKVPRSLAQLQKLEALHEGLDFYLWLSYHFPDIFMDTEQICEMQERVQGIIGEVVSLDTLKNLTDRWRQRRSSEAFKTATVGKRQRRDAGARFRKDIRRLKGNKLLV